jgi:hypothetical protein
MTCPRCNGLGFITDMAVTYEHFPCLVCGVLVRRINERGKALIEQWEGYMPDLTEFEAGVASLVAMPTTDNAFAAMVSLASHIGLGAFKGSTVLKRHNAKNRIGAANAFLFAGKMPTTIRRREAERALYLSGD